MDIHQQGARGPERMEAGMRRSRMPEIHRPLQECFLKRVFSGLGFSRRRDGAGVPPPIEWLGFRGGSWDGSLPFMWISSS